MTIIMKISLAILTIILITKLVLLVMMITKVVPIKIAMIILIQLSTETVRFQMTQITRVLVIGLAIIKLIK